MAAISDTILQFGEPILRQLRESGERPGLASLRSALDIVITVWNAHVMANEAWGHPEHLSDLHRLALDSATTRDTLETLAALGARRQEFVDDIRVVSRWDLTRDDLGQYRFDCTARLPDPDKARAATDPQATLVKCNIMP